MTDEAALIGRAKAGEEAAFVEIYDRCQPAIYSYVSYRVRDPAIAEELTSEVFVRLVSGIGRFRDQGRPLLAWLYTVARNLVADHYRRNSRAAWLPLDESLAAGEETQPARIASHRLDVAALRSAMAQLTELQRQVVWLKFIEGLTTAQTAAVVGKDEGAVKSLQHRALASLRRLLEEGSIHGS